MGDIVKFQKMTTAGYNSLADKRSNTLYFVNDTGDFSPQSMDETEGDIYLGDKLLTGKGCSRIYHPGANVGIGTLDPFGEYTPLESAYNGNQSTKIDTGVNTYNDDVEFRITFKQTQTGVYMRLFGADTGGSLRYRIGFVALNTADITLCSRSGTGTLTSSITRTKDHVYTLVGKLKNGNIALYVRDETTGETDLQTGTYDVDMSYNPRIQLFYLSQQNAYQASGTHVYQATLIVRGATVLNYVPAKRKANNEVGFINTVTGTFVGATSGSWRAGSNADSDIYVIAADVPEIPVFTCGSDETPLAPGTNGLVPSPTHDGRDKFLRGDGSWQMPPSPSDMSGATPFDDGGAGLVPKPLAGDNEKYLSGDGTFKYPFPMFGRCATNAGTKAKTVTVSGPFTLIDGVVVFVRFASSNTNANPTLNVNDTGAKPIVRYGSTVPGTGASTSWNAGSVQCLVYDGTNERWTLLGWLNTTYTDATQSAHGLMSVADKKKLDNLQSSVLQSIIATEDNVDWVPFGQQGFEDAAAVRYNSQGDINFLSLANYTVNDHVEMVVTLTAGNDSDKLMKHVLFSILLMENEEGSYKVVDTLASTLMTIPSTLLGVKMAFNTATLSFHHKIVATDLEDERFIYIRAEEISSANGLPVRFFNTVNDFANDSRHHASAFTLKVWREVNFDL